MAWNAMFNPCQPCCGSPQPCGMLCVGLRCWSPVNQNDFVIYRLFKDGVQVSVGGYYSCLNFYESGDYVLRIEGTRMETTEHPLTLPCPGRINFFVEVPPYRTLTGIVLGCQGFGGRIPIPGVHVQVGDLETYTDATGRYSLTGYIPCNLSYSFTKDRFKPLVTSDYLTYTYPVLQVADGYQCSFCNYWPLPIAPLQLGGGWGSATLTPYVATVDNQGQPRSWGYQGTSTIMANGWKKFPLIPGGGIASYCDPEYAGVGPMTLHWRFESCALGVKVASYNNLPLTDEGVAAFEAVPAAYNMIGPFYDSSNVQIEAEPFYWEGDLIAFSGMFNPWEVTENFLCQPPPGSDVRHVTLSEA